MRQSNKEKKQKKAKDFTGASLPKIYKKKYTQKQLNKKIIKKIFIPADKAFLLKIFAEVERTKKDNPLYSVPADKVFEEADFKRLKKIAKEIKKQKGRVKFAPLIAVLIFIAAIVVFGLFFKNMLIKNVIVNTVQNTTKTRCDLDSVNLDLLNATFELKGFQTASSKDPMLNTFAVDNVTLDFDMLQLLKKRFVANEISVTGVGVNSPRTYSGALTEKELNKILAAEEKKAQKAKEKEEKAKLKAEKKQQEAEEQAQNPKEDSAIVASFKGGLDSSAANVQNSLESIFAPYNPETMLAEMQNALKTPQTVETVKAEIADYIAKYQSLPAELTKDVKDVETIVNDVKKIDIEKIKANPLEAKPAIETLTKSYNTITKLKTETETKVNSIQKDYDKALALSDKVQKAIKSDSDYIKKETGKIKSLTLDDGMKFLSSSFETILCNLLGNYYPYYQKGMDYLNKTKKDKTEKPKKNKTASKRSAGRNIYYKADNCPNLWIKKISGEGEGIAFSILNITDNMDIIDDVATGTFSLSLGGVTHKADVVVDTRTETVHNLVDVAYECNGMPVKVTSSQLGNVPGIPGIDSSVAKITLNCAVKDKADFAVTGKTVLNNVKLSAQSFEPAFINDIYANVLSSMTQMKADFNVTYTPETQLKLKLTTDADKIFAAALKKEIDKELSKVRKQVETELVAKLNEYTNGALDDVQDLKDLKNKVTDTQAIMNNLTKQVEDKYTQAQNIVKGKLDDAEQKAKEAAEEAKRKAEEEARKKADELKKQSEAEAERLKQEAAAEAERKKKEAEAAAAAAAEKAKKEAEAKMKEEAKKKLKGLF